MKSRAGRTHGFTLLETLAVLFLLALIMFLLMEGLASVCHIRRSLKENIINSRPNVLRHHWLRTVLSAMTADGKDGSHQFSGSADRISGLTLAPLFDSAGVPVPITLHIDRGKEGTACNLIYSEELSGQTLQLGHWPDAACSFTCLIRKTKTTSTTEPPLADLQSRWTVDEDHRIQLPEAINFEVKRKEQYLFTLFADIQSRRTSRTISSGVM